MMLIMFQAYNKISIFKMDESKTEGILILNLCRNIKIRLIMTVWNRQFFMIADNAMMIEAINIYINIWLNNKFTIYLE